MRILLLGAIAMGLSAETAKGTFEVKLKPLEGAVTRMSLDKTFAGDLAGTSVGEMLAAMTAVKGSAGYVAMETVTATLGGKRGTFVLQHSGTMAGGKQELSVTVVPDSGTGELAGLSGKMRIIIDGKAHLYEFDYSLGK
ncbi:MAG: DUF3224 domain-containing protein [Bryobacterales bacterium]|nr:DUF3224 domain-containing protein [Bryobacterales bacterium]